MEITHYAAIYWYFGGVILKANNTQKKKYKKKKKKNVALTDYNNEILGILILAYGILTGLSLYYTQSVGMFGQFLKEILLGLFGIPAFVLPLAIVIYSIILIFKKNDSSTNIRYFYGLILLILISALIQTAFYNKKDYENLRPVDSLVKFYLDGNELKGGGILGGLVSTPFLMVFQTLGTIIIISALSIIDVILLTNMSIANFIRGIKKLVQSFAVTLAGAFKAVALFVKNGMKDRRKSDEQGDDEPDDSFEADKKTVDFRPKKTSRELEKGFRDHKMPMPAEDDDIEESEDHVQLIINDFRAGMNVSGSRDEKKHAEDNKAGDGSAGGEIEEQLQQKIREADDLEYIYPPLELLKDNTENVKDMKAIRNAALEDAKKLEDTLKSFGVEAKVVNISRGPAVTRYELQPSPGVKVSKIVNLSDDIALNLASSGVRIEAPIPGKAAVGIEVPNKEISSVLLKEVIDSPEFANFPSKLAFALGKDISGRNIVADIAKMPHLLIAGATGAGKSVCINSLIISLLYKASPAEVKLLMVDPKVVELGVYNGIPHLLIPVVTDPRKAAGALNWAVQEMVNRYKLFAEKGVRDIRGYNQAVSESGEQKPIPQIVIIIDELADLMMVAPHEVEDAICRLAQMARAAGMHLVIATQRPSVDVITGIIKANIPSRISFAVSSQIDSRTILDMAGAEKLLGKGDMLFYPVGEPKPIRVKGAFVSDSEIEQVVEFVKARGNAEYDENIIEEINSRKEVEEKASGDNDELLPQAIDLVVETGQASVSLIQRKFKVGYARAARIIDQMEERGIVGGYEGSKPRQVLISKQQLQEMKMADGE